MMPLVHQDNDRGSGSSQEKRLSLADFLSFDTAQVSEAAAPSTRNNDGQGDWRWQSPGSPEAAPSPRSLVPAACFPPRNSAAFGSYSEGARPGSWAEDSSSHGITELVNSLNALAIPSSQSTRTHSYKTRLSCELLVDSSWPPEGAHSSPREEQQLVLPRRASFCGAAGGAAGGVASVAASVAASGAAGGVAGANAVPAARWSGRLPPRCLDPSGGFSSKVFLGGLPWDIGEQALMQALTQFQPVRVEWPGRDSSVAMRGFAYVTLESERGVRALLEAARRTGPDWYYRITTRNMRSKDVQVIPWAVSDANWVAAGGAGSLRLDSALTVFVGALHGMLSASALAGIMNDLFSGVVYAGIDTDKNKYPIGSGRVTFNNGRSYVRAIHAGYIEIRTDKFTKKIQVNPYLEESMCSVCNIKQGPYFCREPGCFNYFCRSCWGSRHGAEAHTPLTRNTKSAQGSARSAPADPGLGGANHATPSPFGGAEYVPALEWRP